MERDGDIPSHAQHDGTAAQAGQRAQAGIRLNRWPWIWAVPIAAVGVIAWLLVRSLSQGGADITVDLPSADGVTNQTNVTYRGVKIGNVTSLALAKDQKSVVADVHIEDSAEKDLVSGSKFYLEDAKPSLTDLSSLKSVIVGPTLVMVPGKGASARHFTAIVGMPPEHLAAPVTYAVSFSDAAGSLKIGGPVTFRGFNVGEISKLGLTSDAAAGKTMTQVLITLDAARFHIENGGPGALTELLGKLVGQGLRAQLTQDPPFIGPEQVSLAMVPDAPAAGLQTASTYPEIPAVESGGIDALIAKLGKLPVTEIGENVRSITAHVNRLVSSNHMTDMLAHADDTTRELDKAVKQAGPQIGPAIAELHKTASELDAAAATAKQMMGGSVTAPDGNLQQSLRELTQASRAVRSLADYLDRHPESLIRGR